MIWSVSRPHSNKILFQNLACSSGKEFIDLPLQSVYDPCWLFLMQNQHLAILNVQPPCVLVENLGLHRLVNRWPDPGSFLIGQFLVRETVDRPVG